MRSARPIIAARPNNAASHARAPTEEKERHCADVKKILKCSRDALQQLAMLAPSKNNKGAPSGEEGQNT